jgi:fatty-acyl-CoA synthase
VVATPGTSPSAEALVAYLADRVPRWWLPDQWTFIEEIPKTSVGKFDKKVMRVAFAQGDYAVETVALPK